MQSFFGIDEKWLGLVGVFFGAFLVSIKDLISAVGRQRGNAKYMAIRCVALLDRYVDGCAEVAGDDGTYMGQPANLDGTCSAQVDAPAFPVDSMDGDWKSITQNLMYEMLSFSNRIESARGMVKGMSDHASPPFYEEMFEERQYQFARLGLRANQLAGRLRRRYRIPSREMEQWDPVAFLQRQLDEINWLRNNRKKQHDSLLQRQAAHPDH